MIGNEISNTLQSTNYQSVFCNSIGREWSKDGEITDTIPASYHKGIGNRNGTERPFVCFWDGSDCADALTASSDNQRMPDKGRMQCVVANGTSWGGREMSNISGTITTHFRGDTKLILDVAPTLDSSMYTKNNLQDADKYAAVVCCYENHRIDSRITESNDASPTITSNAGTGGVICH